MQSGWFINLGKTEYRDALDLQQTLCFKRAYNDIPDTLILLEHPHIYTTGRQTKTEHLLIDRHEAQSLGAEIIPADRGGSVTYHGPGQLVTYPILNIGIAPDMHKYLRDLEEVLIRTLRFFGIKAQRIPSLTGVWVKNSKIGSIGVKVSRGITKHGFSLNVDPDLSFFNHINACGFNRPVISMRKLLPTTLPRPELINSVLVHSFEEIFNREMIGKGADTISAVGAI